MDDLVEAMLDTARKPDTAGQRTWANWEVGQAIEALQAQLNARDAEIAAWLTKEADEWEAVGDTLAAFAIREAVLTLREKVFE